MTTDEAIAQAESVAAYRAAERRMEREAWIRARAGLPALSRDAMRLAHHVGVERLRNGRGSDPDEWERDVRTHDDHAREGWR